MKEIAKYITPESFYKRRREFVKLGAGTLLIFNPIKTYGS